MIIVSVIKVEPDLITLENDETGETYQKPITEFPTLKQGIQMGQIFEFDMDNGTITFNEEETKSRKEKVAGLLAQLHRV